MERKALVICSCFSMPLSRSDRLDLEDLDWVWSDNLGNIASPLLRDMFSSSDWMISFALSIREMECGNCYSYQT